MEKFSSDFAIETAVKLAEANLKSTDAFVPADVVADFVEEVYCFLTGEDASREGGA